MKSLVNSANNVFLALYKLALPDVKMTQIGHLQFNSLNLDTVVYSIILKKKRFPPLQKHKREEHTLTILSKTYKKYKDFIMQFSNFHVQFLPYAFTYNENI